MCGGVAERRGSGLQSRVHGFKSRLHLEYVPDNYIATRTVSSAVERFVDIEEVTGSIPVRSTIIRDDAESLEQWNPVLNFSRFLRISVIDLARYLVRTIGIPIQAA